MTRAHHRTRVTWLSVFAAVLLASAVIAGCGGKQTSQEVVETAVAPTTVAATPAMGGTVVPGGTTTVVTAGTPSGTPLTAIPVPTGTPTAQLVLGQTAVFPGQELMLNSVRRQNDTVRLMVDLRNTDTSVPLQLHPVFFLMRDSDGQVVMVEQAATGGAVNRTLRPGDMLQNQELIFAFPRPIRTPVQFIYTPGVMYTVPTSAMAAASTATPVAGSPTPAATPTPSASPTETPTTSEGENEIANETPVTAGRPSPTPIISGTMIPEQAINTPGAGVVVSPMDRLQLPDYRVFHIGQTATVLPHRLVLRRVERTDDNMSVIGHFAMENVSTQPIREPNVAFLAIDATGALAPVDPSLTKGLSDELGPGKTATDVAVGFTFDRPMAGPVRILHGEVNGFELTDTDLRPVVPSGTPAGATTPHATTAAGGLPAATKPLPPVATTPQTTATAEGRATAAP